MRKLMWFTLGFGIAVALCAYNVICGHFLLLAAVFMAAAVVFVALSFRKPALVLLGMAVSLAWYNGFRTNQLLPILTLDDTERTITAVCADYSYDTDYGTAVDTQVELFGRQYQVRIYINEKRQLEPGDCVTGTFRLRYTGSGGKEEPTYHFGSGIFLLGYQRGTIEIREGEPITFRQKAAVQAHAIKGILRNLFPEDVFPFTQALLLGDSSDLDYRIDTAFKISGIRHVIAVSGLHVMLLYSLLQAITLRKRYLTALIGIPVLICFAAVAGFTPSVTRAGIMVGLMMLSQVFNRAYDPGTALSFAALTMMTVNPLVITSASFQLSVGCSAGILLFREPISDWLKTKFKNWNGKGIKARLIRSFISSVSVTVSAMVLTTPLSAWYFGTVSLISVVTNLLTLWIINYIFLSLGMLCGISLVYMPLARVGAYLLSWVIRFVLSCAEALASMPLSAVYTASVYIIAWLVFVYILLGIFLFSSRRKPAVLICCAVIGLCTALLASWLEPARDNVRLTVLDVGQGQSIILQCDAGVYLIDCGGEDEAAAADLAAATLLSQGITRLDGIILTHGDRDHAGGVANLLTRIPADRLFLSVTTEAEDAAILLEYFDGEVIWVERETKIASGTETVSIFGPTFASESNENSLCILFEGKNCAILVTGDRGFLGETLLMRQGELPDVDVLIAGHHGSKYSTSEALLEAVHPEVVIISAGADNPYGHPAPELLERLELYGCRIYRTDQNGTIIYRR